MYKWTVKTSRICLPSALDLGNFGIRNIVHHLGHGADSVERLQERFRVLGWTVVFKDPRQNGLGKIREFGVEF